MLYNLIKLYKMSYYFKAHFPSCGCKFNKRNGYMIDTIFNDTAIRNKSYHFGSFQEIEKFLSTSISYSVCIHKNTPTNLLNGGVVVLTRDESVKNTILADFKESEEIQSIRFADKSVLPIREYDNFTPIQEFLNRVDIADYSMLICKQRDRQGNTIYSFPKGKRKLEEDSETCAFREFHEETGHLLNPLHIMKCYQDQIRKRYNLERIPLEIRIHNFLFKILVL